MKLLCQIWKFIAIFTINKLVFFFHSRSRMRLFFFLTLPFLCVVHFCACFTSPFIVYRSNSSFVLLKFVALSYEPHVFEFCVNRDVMRVCVDFGIGNGQPTRQNEEEEKNHNALHNL